MRVNTSARHFHSSNLRSDEISFKIQIKENFLFWSHSFGYCYSTFLLMPSGCFENYSVCIQSTYREEERENEAPMVKQPNKQNKQQKSTIWKTYKELKRFFNRKWMKL